MTAAYITGPDTTVRRQGDALAVTRRTGTGDPEVLTLLRPHELESVVLVGTVHLTADALRVCFDSGIGVAWIDDSGRLRGRAVPESPRSADLRLAQYAATLDAPSRLARASATVAAKLAASAAVLLELASHRPELPSLVPAAEELEHLSLRAAAAADIPSLLGFEGTGARRWFEAYATAFCGDIAFAGRRQNPSPDPANALLSLAYTLLGNRIAALLEARGLDPAVGFLHEVQPGRAGLALDLLEEFRQAVADRFVLRCCNLRIFRSEHFEPDPDRPGGVRLRREPARTFFREWELHLIRPLRTDDPDGPLPVLRRLQVQVDRYAASLRSGRPYVPFQFRG